MASGTKDKLAFIADLAARHGQRLRRFLTTRVQNSTDAADLAQEVFLRLLRVQCHESIRNPEAYLLTVASHVIHQHALRRTTAPQVVDILSALADSSAFSEPDASEQVDLEQNVAAVERALLELPPNVRACFILQRVYGYSLEEIMSAVGIARSTVKKYLVLAVTHCQRRCLTQSRDTV